MDSHIGVINWGSDILTSQGCILQQAPVIILETPWSSVIRFSTSKGDFYLKQTPADPFFSSEPKIIQLLSEKFHASVPVVIAVNENRNCFLMKDAGVPLREKLKCEFKPELLCDAIKQYASILRSTENDIESFLKLGVPDWRLNKLPSLYDEFLRQTAFLKNEGLTEQQLSSLHDLSPRFAAQCELLNSYEIPETLGYHDFHDKNILIDPKSKKLTFVDWSETAIIHPFFSIYNCLEQSITHHGVKENDETFLMLQDAFLQSWEDLAEKNQLLEIYRLAKQVRPIYCLLVTYRFLKGLDRDAYKLYYPNRRSQIAQCLQNWIFMDIIG